MQTFEKVINIASTYLIYILVLFLPLIFTPLTTEYFETGKLLFLGASVLLLLLLWTARAYSEGKITILKTPLDILLLLFWVVAVLSTILSPTLYPALFGVLPKVHGSLIFIVSLVLLYFMVTSNIRGVRDIRVISYLILFSATALSLISLLSFFKIYLPFQFASFQNFSLAGSSSSLTSFLTIILPLSLSLAISERQIYRLSPAALLGLFATILSVILIILIGNLGVWIGALLAVSLTIYYLKPKGDQLLLIGAVGFIAVSLAILSYTPTLKDKTELGKLTSSFQKEVQLDFLTSWKISASAFRDSPILGTGPGTYLYNFTEYKPLEFNKTPLFNTRFSFAHNQYIQTWAEMGGLGVLLLMFISLTFIFIALKSIKDTDIFTKGVGLSAVTFLVVLALSPMSVLGQSIGFIFMGAFMSTLLNHHRGVHQMEVNLQSPQLNSGQAGYGSLHPLIPSMIFVPVLILALFGFYFLGKLALGEYYHKKALNSLSENNALGAYNLLIQAERVNPQADLYRVDLAQTNFALANGIALAKGPTQASPSGSLTDEDRRNIQQLLQQSIAEGRAAVQLSPRSAGNWEVLANIYRQISGVATAGTAFALDSYGKAIRQDPLNPLLRLTVGGIYYQAKNYDLAVRFFDDAVALKPDFSNGLYNLSIALRDKGNTQDSIKVAERLVANLQDKPTSEDYRKASELLSELKEKASEAVPAPTTQPSSPLEQSLLPKVDIGEPEKISTPPAVQR